MKNTRYRAIETVYCVYKPWIVCTFRKNKKIQKNCWLLSWVVVFYISSLMKRRTTSKKDRKRLERGCKKSWKKFLTNNKRHDKINELLLRTKATRWTLKMKDWTVFKTLKILIKKSLWLRHLWMRNSEHSRYKVQAWLLAGMGEPNAKVNRTKFCEHKPNNSRTV